MKTNLVLAGGLLTAWVALADDPKGGQALMESQSTNAPAAKAQNKPAVVKPPPSNQILGHPVQYGGFFSDMARTNNKRAFFNLKTPIDPQKDFENLSFYPETDKVQGFILFSVKF